MFKFIEKIWCKFNGTMTRAEYVAYMRSEAIQREVDFNRLGYYA